MVHTQKLRKPPGREERHSAAWGKRLSMTLLLATEWRFGQRVTNEPARSGRIADELSGLLAKAHQGSTKGQTVKVIVQYKQVPTTAHYATMHNRGGLLHAKLHMIKGAAFTIPASALPALEADPEIVSVTIDHPMNVMDDTTNDATGVNTAWNAGYNGAGVGVAVIDSVSTIAIPICRIQTGYHVWSITRISPEPRLPTPVEHSTTCTVMARTSPEFIGGNGSLSGGQYEGGGSRSQSDRSSRVGCERLGTDSMVIAAIQQAIALQQTYNIRIINLSLGRGIPVSYTQDPLCQAVEAAWKSGIVVVVAAGNYGRLSVNGSSGYGTITAPGNDPFVLTVGATRATDPPTPRLRPSPATVRRGPRRTIS